MTFNSIPFLIFYPIVLLLYFVLPKKIRWVMLLGASYFFYAFYSPELLFLIIGTTLVSWLCAMLIEKTQKRGVRVLALLTTLLISLGTLFFYKYFDFLSKSLFDGLALFGYNGEPVLLNLVLPVGISFYTFQTLSYVIDVYRGNVKTEKNFFFYALFVSFFPQLVAGPIERPGNLIPQLKADNKWDKENAIKGVKQMLLGFFKKVCVADLVAGSVNSIYNQPGEATSLGIVIATLLFAVQIYCDFSGYTDIATGCARIMGIRLMKNFDHPYRAKTIKEFWSRWHISLSGWFKDYLYIPLGGSRKGKCRHLLNLFIVFMVSGIWHGAEWTFIIWGVLHAVYQIFGTLTIAPRNKLLSLVKLSEKNFIVSAIRRINTFILVCVAWLAFRANNVGEMFTLIKRLFTFTKGGFAITMDTMGLNLISVLTIVSSIAVMLMLDNLIAYSGKDGSAAVVNSGAAFYFVWVIAVIWLLIASRDAASSFIYFAF